MTSHNIIADIQGAIERADNILVVTHVSPDGDAIGSITAMGQALRQLGKRFTLVCDDRIPKRFDYLPQVEQIQSNPDNRFYDLVIAVDCGDVLRMGEAYSGLPEPKTDMLINIDHHITNTYFGDINFVSPKSTSTTEMLYDFFMAIGVDITTNVALSLLTGLVTDTLGFRTDGVTSHTLKIAGVLVDRGADLSLITMRGLKIKPMSTLQLWRVGLNNLRFEEGLVWATISQQERQAIGYTSSSSAGLVNLLADVEQAVMGAVLIEMDDNSISVGFRCNPPYSVAELALNLGGGGHPLAAGCTLPGSLSDVESLVVMLSKESIRNQQAHLFSSTNNRYH